MGGVVHTLNGTTSNFACAVSGTSPLTTSWELQTMSGEINRIGSTFSSLLTQDDEGIYTCVVVNEQEGLSDNVTVTVRVYGEHASVQECAVVSYVYGNACALWVCNNNYSCTMKFCACGKLGFCLSLNRSHRLDICCCDIIGAQ